MKIIDIVKYEGDNSTFIWKHPAEDFNIFSQLIVHESQEAFFFKDGQTLDAFGPGRYTLESQNIPILSSLIKLGTGGESPFHCEVYFVNKTVQMAIKWGTDSKVHYVDPESGIPIELGASGYMNLEVLDGRRLLTRLVGTMKGIAWDDQTGFTKSLQNCFRPLISSAVKSNLSVAIKNEQFDILEIDEHLESLSEVLLQKIRPGFEEYGLTIPQFYLTNVVLPEDDLNFKRLRELHTISMQTRMVRAEAVIKTEQAKAEANVVAAKREAELERQTTQTEIAKREAERKIIAAQGDAEAVRAAGFAEADVMKAKGYNQKDVLQADVQKAYAQGLGNMGSHGGSSGGGVASDMIGVMAGMKMAGMVMGEMNGILDGKQTSSVSEGSTEQAQPGGESVVCSKCGAKLPENAKFCLECGEKVLPKTPDGMVICPSCGKMVPKGKFCLECGTPMINKCPQCGAEIPAGGKFCLECGAKL